MARHTGIQRHVYHVDHRYIRQRLRAGPPFVLLRLRIAGSVAKPDYYTLCNLKKDY